MLIRVEIWLPFMDAATYCKRMHKAKTRVTEILVENGFAATYDGEPYKPKPIYVRLSYGWFNKWKLWSQINAIKQKWKKGSSLERDIWMEEVCDER